MMRRRLFKICYKFMKKSKSYFNSCFGEAHPNVIALFRKMDRMDLIDTLLGAAILSVTSTENSVAVDFFKTLNK